MMGLKFFSLKSQALWFFVFLYFMVNLWASTLTWQECRKYMPFLKQIPQTQAFKTRHVIQYGPLAVLSSLALVSSFPKNHFFLILAGGVLIAASSGGLAEVIQVFIPTRIPSIKDVFFNLLGALIGNGIFGLMVFIKKCTLKTN